MTRSSLEAA
jgi:hypothetical protein